RSRRSRTWAGRSRWGRSRRRPAAAERGGSWSGCVGTLGSPLCRRPRSGLGGRPGPSLFLGVGALRRRWCAGWATRGGRRTRARCRRGWAARARRGPSRSPSWSVIGRVGEGQQLLGFALTHPVAASEHLLDLVGGQRPVVLELEAVVVGGVARLHLRGGERAKGHHRECGGELG